MTEPIGQSEKILRALQERTKELNCLYAVEKLLNDPELPFDETLEQVVRVIPQGWQYPQNCRARIVVEGKTFQEPDCHETPWGQCVTILAQERQVGMVCVYYLTEPTAAEGGAFLPEEARLVETIADRLGHYVQHIKLKAIFEEFRHAEEELAQKSRGEWRGAIRLLRKTDPNLYLRISRKMMNHLCWSGITEAQREHQAAGADAGPDSLPPRDENFPQEKRSLDLGFFLSDRPFEIASHYLSDEEILSRVERWIFEDKSSVLVKVLASQQSSLDQIAEAIRRFHQVVPEGAEVSRSIMSGIRVSLIRRFLTEQLEFITVAKNHVEPRDFLELLDRLILPAGSHGKLGGKSAGLFLAYQILRRAADRVGFDIRIPRSWNIASDGLISFIEYNDLEEIIEHKYKEIDQIRQEYPHVVQLFQNARFPPELVKGLSLALDEFGDRPLIVRSSSLLEDRLGTAFSGKYKSLFLANQGDKRQRLSALMNAIAEIYASTFGPDPIEYRRERGLLDFNEEMGILLQEVVGARVGRYFLPAFAGVAFSHNEFRWSPRIRREDGLLRLVPGLGTRAVDRVSDDYPVLVAPGQPGLRTNVALDDVLRYSPRHIDVIDLEKNVFVTLTIEELLRSCGADYPAFRNIFSRLQEDHLAKPVGLMVDPARDRMVATMEGLIQDTPFVGRMHRLLQTLEESLQTPVDVEFAHDGKDLFLLQCRPQSQSGETAPAPIPKDIRAEDVVFSARRHVSNGSVPEITHLVYVDPLKYGEIEDHADLVAVGRAVGRLNQVLPKRQFVLMGPGRWGSKGDIKLGVSVGYADISNCAVLIEIARKKGNYVPDLSFGTHFFQDLVESGIRYLPLYPDEEGVIFNEHFLKTARNILSEVLPDFAWLADVLRVIDVPQSAGGRILRLLMNADLDEALAYLSTPGSRDERGREAGREVARSAEDHWRWRMQVAERLASECDGARFGVLAFYVFGSTKNATAGPGSDIDLLLHVRGTPEQHQALSCWLNGWSQALAHMNYLRTGYRSDGLLDVHFVTDDDIARHTSFASKIGAVTDSAKQLPMKGEPPATCT
ncbi:MAG: pyruvate, phosphate dikinase [Myxococcales bacterium]|nr:pyruvate, phosphate dikinase [Myxococcales bacterium]